MGDRGSFGVRKKKTDLVVNRTERDVENVGGWCWADQDDKGMRLSLHLT
jgi:hypothetical protein